MAQGILHQWLPLGTPRRLFQVSASKVAWKLWRHQDFVLQAHNPRRRRAALHRSMRSCPCRHLLLEEPALCRWKPGELSSDKLDRNMILISFLSQECLDCVAWGLSQEPGHTVLATVDVQQTQEEACRDLVSREAPKNRALQIDDGNQKALTFENMSSTASMTSETSFSTATSSRVSSNSQGPWARPVS